MAFALRSVASTAVVAVSLAALPVLAQSASPITGIDALKEWNLVVLGNLESSSEVEGRTFVGGNLSGNSSNYNIRGGTPSTNGQPGLTVVGDVTGGHKNLNNGSGAVVGGNVNSGFNLNGSPQTVKVGGSSGGGSSSGGSDPVPVPEPGMVGLFGLGVAGLLYLRRRRAQNGDE